MTEYLSIPDMLYGLVGVQSDTGTALENNAAEYLFSIIKKDKYFIKNPELCGKYIGRDNLKRPVVWALKRSNNESNKTIILSGHYDCVEIDCYGELKEYALKPELLKKKLQTVELPSEVKKDLNSDKWIFGRGVNDMKAGLAINLHTLFNSDYKNLNVLFVAVSDEENLSSGMRDATAILTELKSRYKLDYKLMLLPEPHMGREQDSFKLYTGTVGKIMPAIVAKGILGHGSEVMSSLNASFIMSNIISDTELNDVLCSIDGDMATQPPTVLYARDQKESYDVSVTEYSACYMNYQFLATTTVDDISLKLKNICQHGIDKAIEKYDGTFQRLAERGYIQENKKADTYYRIMTYSELVETAEQSNAEFIKAIEKYKTEIYQSYNEDKINIQQVSVSIIKKSIELSNIEGMIIVIGFIPPYYPAVKNDDLDSYSEYITNVLSEEYDMSTEVEPYFMGISDISYTRCNNKEQEKLVMTNMVCDSKLYDISFEEIASLNFPSMIVGPLGQNYHTKYERVLMSDVTDKIPQLFKRIMNKIDNE